MRGDDRFPHVRIEVGPTAVFTRVFIDDRELRGVTRVWFDSGDVDPGDRPRKAFRDVTRVHLEFYPSELVVDGNTSVDLLKVEPMYAPVQDA